MPTSAPLRSAPPRGVSPFAWAAPYGIAGFAVAALLHFDVIPLRAWLSPPPATASLEPSPPAPRTPRARDVASETPPTTAPRAPHPALSPLALAALELEPTATFTSLRPRVAEETAVEPAGRAEPVALSRRAQATRGRGALARRAGERGAAREHAPTLATRAGPATREKTPTTASAPDAALAVAKRSAPSAAATSGAVSRSAGKSCEAAIASYREEVKLGKSDTPDDISAARYGAVLNRGTYFSHCGAPDTMRIHICAAVQHGAAVGVTVTTEPGNAKVASCVATAVRGLAFPSHPRMDVTRTSFE